MKHEREFSSFSSPFGRFNFFSHIYRRDQWHQHWKCHPIEVNKTILRPRKWNLTIHQSMNEWATCDYVKNIMEYVENCKTNKTQNDSQTNTGISICWRIGDCCFRFDFQMPYVIRFSCGKVIDFVHFFTTFSQKCFI